jgi:hypothetical protein
MIPTTFDEETEISSDGIMNNLKSYHKTYFMKVHKDFIDYIENSMLHDFKLDSKSVLDLRRMCLCK